MADETDAFIQEIDDELRQEKAEQIWKQYGNYIVGAVRQFQFSRCTDEDRDITVMAGNTVIRGDFTERGEGRLQIAVFDMKGGFIEPREERVTGRRVGGDDTKGRQRLLRLAVSQQYLSRSELFTLFEPRVPIIGLPCLISTDAGNHGDDGSDVLLKRAADLASGAGPWRHSAAEIVALDALRSGDKGKAREMFEKIVADTTAPRGIQQRAREMLTIAGQ